MRGSRDREVRPTVERTARTKRGLISNGTWPCEMFSPKICIQHVSWCYRVTYGTRSSQKRFRYFSLNNCVDRVKSARLAKHPSGIQMPYYEGCMFAADIDIHSIRPSFRPSIRFSACPNAYGTAVIWPSTRRPNTSVKKVIGRNSKR